MSVKLGIIMDPIQSIFIEKDTSFALLLEAERRDYEIYYMEPHQIWLEDGLTWGFMRRLHVKEDPEEWYELGDIVTQPLVELDMLLMRKDPPFDMNYIYLTYLLEHAQNSGLVVVNNPRSLRDANEKLFTSWFPQCCPKTLVTANNQLLKEFINEEEEAVLKPLDGMGGKGIFHARYDDDNLNAMIETLTSHGQQMAMAQKFIPEIRQGDKRILLINGEPVPYALARIPAHGDFRGNLAAGANSVGRELTDRDLWICEEVAPTLKEKGLYFVGLDVIGDYLTEINVTSPTCLRQLDREFGLNIAADVMDFIESLL